MISLAVYGLGCGVAQEAATDMPGTGGSTSGAGGSTGHAGTGGSAGSAGADQPAPELSLLIEDSDGLYTPMETIKSGPHEEIDVWVHVSDGPRTVRFALLPNDEPVTSGGNTPGDAALDATEVTTDEDGYGLVLLTAPGSPTTFLLRASAGSAASAQLRFSVQTMGTATLDVVPLYNGSRTIGQWTASFVRDTTCANLVGTPPDDGERATASDGDTVQLEDVPVGVKLAILVRAERFVWGCANLTTAVEGSMPERVEIVANDVPIRLDESRVELELSLASLDGWTGALDAPLAEVRAAIRDGADDDVEALLDAMADSLDSGDRAVFSATRGSETWDLRVRDALGARAETLLTEPLGRWLTAGLDGLDGEAAFSGVLASDAAGGSAELVLHSVFGLDPEEAGFTVPSRGLWMVSADDVVFGMPLDFTPAKFLIAAAEAPALDEVDGAKTIADALSELVPCSEVAAALTSYPDCDADCFEDTCRAGLDALVERLATLDTGTATLDVAASGETSVGPNAELETFDGDWIGKLDYDDEIVDVGGTARATSAE